MAKFYRSEDKTVLLEVFGAGSSIENLKNLKANTTDAAVEKHLPVVTQEWYCIKCSQAKQEKYPA